MGTDVIDTLKHRRRKLYLQNKVEILLTFLVDLRPFFFLDESELKLLLEAQHVCYIHIGYPNSTCFHCSKEYNGIQWYSIYNSFSYL